MKFKEKKLRHVLIHGHPLGKIKSKGEKNNRHWYTKKRRTNNEELNSIRPSKRKQKTCYINMTLVRQKKRNLTKEEKTVIILKAKANTCYTVEWQGFNISHIIRNKYTCRW